MQVPEQRTVQRIFTLPVVYKSLKVFVGSTTLVILDR